MYFLLLACQLLPLLGGLAILALGRDEKRIAELSAWTTHAMGAAIFGLLMIWSWRGWVDYEYLWATLYQHGDYHFHLLFFLDKIGAAYLFCTWVIFSVIVRYCRVYLHREPGYKRFFLTIFAFVFGLNMVILSGSLDMLFAGWEIVGISSFLLIAFYRHRPQPVRNALRAYSVYRFCDLGLLLGALFMDLWLHGNNHFSELPDLFKSGTALPGGDWAILALSLCLIIAASGKSAQFPFCFWLPRAMEGPTPSSAIFYGALAVHLGVFLLLRTQVVWHHSLIARFLVGCIGLLTVIVASLAERAQSNIKGQIAYASIAQVGLMFVELAVGLELWVLPHFLGNAFLRCYQLLVSPSVVAHLLRVEGAADTGFDIRSSSFARTLPVSLRDSLPAVLENTLMVCALQEFNLEYTVRRLFWDPLARAGRVVNRWSIFDYMRAALILLALSIFGLATGWLTREFLAIPAAFAMLAVSLGAFAQKRNVFKVWNQVGLSSVLAGLVAWLLSAPNSGGEIGLFLAGIVPAWLLGSVVLYALLRDENFTAAPFLYRAMAERKPYLAWLLFISFLGLVSFPITPAFIGEDMLLYQVSTHMPWLVALIALSFVLNGVAAASVFQRLCMGRPADVRH